MKSDYKFHITETRYWHLNICWKSVIEINIEYPMILLFIMLQSKSIKILLFYYFSSCVVYYTHPALCSNNRDKRSRSSFRLDQFQNIVTCEVHMSSGASTYLTNLLRAKNTSVLLARSYFTYTSFLRFPIHAFRACPTYVMGAADGLAQRMTIPECSTLSELNGVVTGARFISNGNNRTL